MQTNYITLNDKKYIVEGDVRSGFTVYELKNGHKIYAGRSNVVATPKMAVIHVEREKYSMYY